MLLSLAAPLLLAAAVLCPATLAAPAEAKEQQQQQLGSSVESRPIIEFTPGFPNRAVRNVLGQVSGVAIDKRGATFLFRRSHSWGDGDFDADNNYNLKQRGAMKQPAVIEVDPNGNAVAFYGEGIFYMPHGISVDNEGRLWTTDVARHQVIRIDTKTGVAKQLLGEAFVPGNDTSHLCQPTKVVVASTGDFFVADGYCNSRVMKFNKDGKFLGQFGRKPDGGSLAADSLQIPHGLALLERMDLLCVADREHKRVQCFHAGLKQGNKFGDFVQSVDSRLGRVFDVAFLPNGQLLILHRKDEQDFSLVNIYDLALAKTVGQFTHLPDTDIVADEIRGLGIGHAVSASPSGSFAVVSSLDANCDTDARLCELGLSVPYQVYRFGIEQQQQQQQQRLAASSSERLRM